MHAGPQGQAPYVMASQQGLREPPVQVPGMSGKQKPKEPWRLAQGHPASSWVRVELELSTPGLQAGTPP